MKKHFTIFILLLSISSTLFSQDFTINQREFVSKVFSFDDSKQEYNHQTYVVINAKRNIITFNNSAINMSTIVKVYDSLPYSTGIHYLGYGERDNVKYTVTIEYYNQQDTVIVLESNSGKIYFYKTTIL